MTTPAAVVTAFPPSAERRRRPRHAVKLGALRQSSGRYQLENVVDLSEGGVKLEPRERLAPGTRLRLVLVSVRHGLEMAVTGTVVRAAPNGENVVAISFDPRGPDQGSELERLIAALVR